MKEFSINDYVVEYDSQAMLIRSNLKDAREEGIEQGQQIGEESKAKEIAKRMILKEKVNEEIQELTGLSIEEIEKLRKDIMK